MPEDKRILDIVDNLKLLLSEKTGGRSEDVITILTLACGEYAAEENFPIDLVNKSVQYSYAQRLKNPALEPNRILN